MTDPGRPEHPPPSGRRPVRPRLPDPPGRRPGWPLIRPPLSDRASRPERRSKLPHRLTGPGNPPRLEHPVRPCRPVGRPSRRSGRLCRLGRPPGSAGLRRWGRPRSLRPSGRHRGRSPLPGRRLCLTARPGRRWGVPCPLSTLGRPARSVGPRRWSPRPGPPARPEHRREPLRRPTGPGCPEHPRRPRRSGRSLGRLDHLRPWECRRRPVSRLGLPHRLSSPGRLRPSGRRSHPPESPRLPEHLDLSGRPGRLHGLLPERLPRRRAARPDRIRGPPDGDRAPEGGLPPVPVDGRGLTAPGSPVPGEPLPPTGRRPSRAATPTPRNSPPDALRRRSPWRARRRSP